MITAIILISTAFTWFLWETDWLTIRLPYGKALQSNSRGLEMGSNNISLPAPKLESNPVTFTLLDMPDTNGNINIVCVRE